jgi:hypothetical protein
MHDGLTAASRPVTAKGSLIRTWKAVQCGTPPHDWVDVAPIVCCAWIVGLPSGGLLTLLMGCWRL